MINAMFTTGVAREVLLWVFLERFLTTRCAKIIDLTSIL